MRIKYRNENQYEVSLVPKDGKYYHSWENEVGHRFSEEFFPLYFLGELENKSVRIISINYEESRKLIKLVFLRFV